MMKVSAALLLAHVAAADVYLPPGYTCADVQAGYAKLGYAGSLAWLFAHGFSLMQARRIAKACHIRT